jgi:hypothetical protein
MQFWSVNVAPKYLNFATFSKDLLTSLIFCPPQAKVNHHNVQVWAFENPQVVCKHACDSPKDNVFYANSNKKDYGLLFIENSYWDVLSGYVDELDDASAS